MRILARENHVLWVNFHASRRPQLSRGDAGVIVRRLRQAFGGPRHVAPRIDVLSPLLVPLPNAGAARWLNGWLLARQIRQVLRRLPRRPLQLWLFTPDVPELIDRMRAERIVYYCVDEFSAFAGYDRPLIERLEAQTIALSDLVVTTSPELYAHRARCHHCVHLVPHGVDIEHFVGAPSLAEQDVPADVARLPRPRFGYMGLVADYVDLPLLGEAARARPDWSFVLIGDVRTSLAPLRNLPNVQVLGGRPYESLPAYCRGFDVGLIPFRMNRLVRAVNPIKLREYLAAGLPVVSAPMEAVQAYAPHVLTAVTAAEFLAACERALELGRTAGPAQIQRVVQHEGWAARVTDLARLVTELPPTDDRDRRGAVAGDRAAAVVSTT